MKFEIRPRAHVFDRHPWTAPILPGRRMHVGHAFTCATAFCLAAAFVRSVKAFLAIEATARRGRSIGLQRLQKAGGPI